MKTRLLITALLGLLFTAPAVADGESTAGVTVGAFGESNESTAWRIVCHPWRLWIPASKPELRRFAPRN